MWRRRDCKCRKTIVGLMAAAVCAAVAVPAAPAAAGNLFDFLFGGFHRQAPTVHVHRSDDFAPSEGRRHRHNEESVRSSEAPHSGFCVRLCDGRYYPIQAQRNASAAEQCNAFCPASETKVFSGSGIEHASARNGQRYADLPNAFLYRKRLVSGCTCNGKSAAGLANVPVSDDPTLRPGDIVATNSGLTVYNGKDSQRHSAFTPIRRAKVSRSVRNQLADVKVTPRPPSLDTAAEPNPQDHAANAAGGLRQLSAR